MKLNQKGAIDMVLVAALAVVLVVGGFVLVRIQDDSDGGNSQDSAEVADESVDLQDDSNLEDDAEAIVEDESESTEDDTETSSEPVEQVEEGEPEAKPDLYSTTPVPTFIDCPVTTTAYVVNPNGAKIYDTYYSSTVVDTLAFGAQVTVGCQDGEGQASMSVYYSGNERAGTPADYRTTNPN